jgi:hypothetical protein
MNSTPADVLLPGRPHSAIVMGPEGMDSIDDERAWATLSNGESLVAAEEERFEVLVTTDLRLMHPRNLGRRVSLGSSCPRRADREPDDRSMSWSTKATMPLPEATPKLPFNE